MRTAIVYEGTHGCSAAVARIIAAEAAVHGPVIVGEVHEIPLSELEGVEFLVVGGPTHRWEDWADISRTPSAAHVLREFHATSSDGVRNWLDHLPPRPSFSAATFDTREPGLRVLDRHRGPLPLPRPPPPRLPPGHPPGELPGQARSGL